MGNKHTATEAIKDALRTQERSFAWLSRETGIPYKRLLREVKHAESPLTLLNAALIADAIGVDLPVLVSGKVAA